MNYCPYCMNELKGNESVCGRCGKEPASYTAPPHMLPHEALLNNRYLVGSVIGEGGFGITYIGLDSLLDYRVAIKEFYPNGMVNRNNTVSNDVRSISAESAKDLISKSREHFLGEARMLAKFNNEKGIVEVKDFFEENNTVYIVMEYLDGITLKKYLERVGTISAYNTVCLLMPVFNSLRKVHRKNLIHRDISPDNIMLVDEEVKLLDFGAARQFADEKSLSVMLKHGYAPLEQYRRHGAQGSWTDVYAICATMYKCITGQIPPDAPDRIYEDELKMPSELGIEVPPKFEEVLRHGLAIKADDRIQDIDGLLAELSEVPGFEMLGDAPAAPSGTVRKVSASAVASDSDSGRTIAQPQDEEMRFSQYIAAPLPDDEPEPRPVPAPQPSPEPAPLPQNTEEPPQVSTEPSEPAAVRRGGKGGMITAIAAAAVLLVGVGVFLSVRAGKDSIRADSTADTEKASSSPQIKVMDSEAESSENETVTTTSAAPTESDTSEVSQPDESSDSGNEIVYDADSFFFVTDNFFTIDYTLLDSKREDIEKKFGIDPETVDYNCSYWIEGEAVMTLSIPVTRVGEDGSETTDFEPVKLFFKNGLLAIAMYEIDGGFNDSVVGYATATYGEATTINGAEMEWLLSDKECMYQAYVHNFNEEQEERFAQMYISHSYLKEQDILE
ncbi:Serine/threonine protein kinase [Ruminococcus sp. YE71]|uniref:serine/threonine protein kinase n=1 Tax=unclassified Ruminococcus TaxID=2608920 RepID=UPI0008820863|nr:MULTISPECIES: serine/threonine-protein kinase [unclassified Ruminococcus]SDA23087.1 Serine/threonine protein kinase [Ruminococcus sp. YE78]SFW39258.1 Serine/threonine protein kinase [Ruminococcus sp. YE71]